VSLTLSTEFGRAAGDGDTARAGNDREGARCDARPFGWVDMQVVGVMNLLVVMVRLDLLDRKSFEVPRQRRGEEQVRVHGGSIPVEQYDAPALRRESRL
jgi:hypothetical protein